MLGNGDETPDDREIKGRNNLKMSCGNGVGHEIKPNRLPPFYAKKMLLLFYSRQRHLIAGPIIHSFSPGKHLFGHHVYRQRMN